MTYTKEETRLTAAHVEEMYAHRKHMLSSVEAHISDSLREVLETKIRYENVTLSDIIESDAKIVVEKKKLNKILNPHYFTQKPLSANLL